MPNSSARKTSKDPTIEDVAEAVFLAFGKGAIRQFAVKILGSSTMQSTASEYRASLKAERKASLSSERIIEIHELVKSYVLKTNVISDESPVFEYVQRMKRAEKFRRAFAVHSQFEEWASKRAESIEVGHADTVKGAANGIVAGATVGALVAGPIGAGIGAIIVGLSGAMLGHPSEKVKAQQYTEKLLSIGPKLRAAMTNYQAVLVESLKVIQIENIKVEAKFKALEQELKDEIRSLSLKDADFNSAIENLDHLLEKTPSVRKLLGLPVDDEDLHLNLVDAAVAILGEIQRIK